MYTRTYTHIVAPAPERDPLWGRAGSLCGASLEVGGDGFRQGVS